MKKKITKIARPGAPQSTQQTTVIHKNKKAYNRKKKHKGHEN